MRTCTTLTCSYSTQSLVLYHVQSLLCLLQKKMKAEELIEALHSHRDVDIDEKDFFSLFYYDTATPKPQKAGALCIILS